MNGTLAVLLLIIAGLNVLGMVGGAFLIGRPRKAVTPGTYAGTLAFGLAYVTVFVLSALALLRGA
jgi:hypothetical protein